MEKHLKSISGSDLSNALTDHSLADLVPKCQAIYFWRRNLTPPAHVVANAHQFALWIQSAVQIPFARINQRSLSHFLTLPGFDLGGGALTDDKIAHLSHWLDTKNRRDWTKKFLDALTFLAPPLYVGETCDLQQRVQQHLKGLTDFGHTLKEGLRLKWKDLILFYYHLGPAQADDDSVDNHKGNRTLLELLAARMVLAGCTSRPG